MTSGAQNIFPTPVFVHDLLGFGPKNDALSALAYSLRDKDPVGTRRSNTSGGWHSADNVMVLDFVEALDLKAVILDALKVVVDGMGYRGLNLALAASWFVISPPGAANMRHSHPRAFLSGVYYVRAPEGSSPLVFHDPRPARAHSAPPSAGSLLTPYVAEAAKFDAVEGRLCVFPGWLDHSVQENESAGDRVALSFNVFYIQ